MNFELDFRNFKLIDEYHFRWAWAMGGLDLENLQKTDRRIL